MLRSIGLVTLNAKYIHSSLSLRYLRNAARDAGHKNVWIKEFVINQPVWKIASEIQKQKPDILGMSALLTTTMPYMKVVIDCLVEKGIRDNYIVLVGGAPLNEEFGKAIGADAYCRDAAMAVETAKDFMKKKHNQMISN